MNCKRSQTPKGTYYANPFMWSVWDRWIQKDRKQIGGFKELKSGTEWGITALQVCGDKNKKWSAVWWENPRGLWELSAGQRPALALKPSGWGYSLEGLMLKLKLQYFGHLLWTADSLGKTLMMGKTDSKRERGWQKMRWLASITDSMDMNLGKLQKIVRDR